MVLNLCKHSTLGNFGRFIKKEINVLHPNNMNYCYNYYLTNDIILYSGVKANLLCFNLNKATVIIGLLLSRWLFSRSQYNISSLSVCLDAMLEITGSVPSLNSNICYISNLLSPQSFFTDHQTLLQRAIIHSGHPSIILLPPVLQYLTAITLSNIKTLLLSIRYLLIRL